MRLNMCSHSLIDSLLCIGIEREIFGVKTTHIDTTARWNVRRIWARVNERAGAESQQLVASYFHWPHVVRPSSVFCIWCAPFACGLDRRTLVCVCVLHRAPVTSQWQAAHAHTPRRQEWVLHCPLRAPPPPPTGTPFECTVGPSTDTPPEAERTHPQRVFFVLFLSVVDNVCENWEFLRIHFWLVQNQEDKKIDLPENTLNFVTSTVLI